MILQKRYQKLLHQETAEGAERGCSPGLECKLKIYVSDFLLIMIIYFAVGFQQCQYLRLAESMRQLLKLCPDL